MLDKISEELKAKLIDGKKFSLEVFDELKVKVDNLDAKAVKPKLVVVIVGDDFASHVYIKRKILACKKIGFLSEVVQLPEESSFDEVKTHLVNLNNDPSVHGILLQIPLPKHLLSKQEELLQTIDFNKDVDCFNFYNFGKVAKNDVPIVYPCTPYGIVKLLEKYNIDVKSKRVTIIGFSNILGKPLALMLEALKATISVCNIFTKDLSAYTKDADIIVCATGKKDVITVDMVKEGSVIIDAGILRDENNKVRGDVDYKTFLNKCAYITPVPRGVGPVTIAMLMENL